jgi:hypothetical protein
MQLTYRCPRLWIVRPVGTRRVIICPSFHIQVISCATCILIRLFTFRRSVQSSIQIWVDFFRAFEESERRNFLTGKSEHTEAPASRAGTDVLNITADSLPSFFSSPRTPCLDDSLRAGVKRRSSLVRFPSLSAPLRAARSQVHLMGTPAHNIALRVLTRSSASPLFLRPPPAAPPQVRLVIAGRRDPLLRRLSTQVRAGATLPALRPG